MKKYVSLLLSLFLFLSSSIAVFSINTTNNEAENENLQPFEVNATSCVLIEANTGELLYSKNPDEMLPPASVTKIMTILLIAEAIDEGKIALTDKVSISEHASSMGGSQVFLKEGEIMSVEDLLKCTIISSANDAALALAEFLMGSEEGFVNEMNRRANELGMENTVFENVTGLDDTTSNHLTSAKDISIMSRELLKHGLVTKYSSLWQDSIRNGSFILTNTNRLVRYYDGCNGLKTGSTAKAGYCISVSAERDGMELIAVIMNAESRDERNKIARELLDYGFANFTLYSEEEKFIEEVPVYFGSLEKIKVYSKKFSALIKKGDLKNVNSIYQIPEYIDAPVTSGDIVGKIEYRIGEEIIGSSDLYVKEDAERLGYFDILLKIFKTMIGMT